MLEALLYPEAIAVIGASKSPGKVGFAVLDNLIKAGYQGKIIPAKRNEAQQVAAALEQLLRKYPATKAGKEAEKLMSQWKST